MHTLSVPLAGTVVSLTAGWELLLLPPGATATPESLAAHTGWLQAVVPGTVAATLKAAGRWSLETPRDFDAEEAWYRCRFTRPAAALGSRIRLCFDGLATLADVFLNGVLILSAENMYVRHVVDVTDALRDDSELTIRFRALIPELKLRKARPRWRTKMVEQQQLRWVRTTLLGRATGWSPPVAPVGPFGGVRLEVAERAVVLARRIDPAFSGDDGTVTVHVELEPIGGARVASVELSLDGHAHALSHAAGSDGRVSVRGEVAVPAPARWWPHTHGAQPRLRAELVVRFADGTEVRHPSGHVAFRDVTLDTDGGAFAIRVNGERVFCRGACWTPLDVVTLAASPEALRAALLQARNAGMNMIRVGGTMVYEDDAFYEACDELGILVWQDFMFANMDYPAAEEAFMANVHGEALQVLGRLRGRPSVAVLCGGSEVAQQAAMMGMPRDLWTNELFARVLPALVQAECPGVPYWPSSPYGGDMPFHVSSGATHYYGVGAYERPFEDARRANVRFASECLAFANVPEEALLERMLPEGQPAVHHPLWKTRSPRDRGAPWDFDDIRDHYMTRLFGGVPAEIRYGDPERYLDLARVTTGEVMARTFSEWRRPGSTCQGGLVWFHRDLWPGAGWGVVDSTGAPKAAYWYLRRVLQPRVVLLSDEGMDGLHVHALCESPEPLEIDLSVTLLRLGEVPIASGTKRAMLAPRGSASFSVQSFFETFIDVTYAYRFGPPSHDLVVVAMTDAASGSRIDTAFHFPLGLPQGREPDVGLDAIAEPIGESEWAVTVSTKRFAQSVSFQLRGAMPDDDYFHLEPGGSRRVVVRAATPTAKLSGSVRALNAHASAKIRVVPGPGSG